MSVRCGLAGRWSDTRRSGGMWRACATTNGPALLSVMGGGSVQTMIRMERSCCAMPVPANSDWSWTGQRVRALTCGHRYLEKTRIFISLQRRPTITSGILERKSLSMLML